MPPLEECLPRPGGLAHDQFQPRAEAMCRVAESLLSNHDDYAMLITQEMGKPLGKRTPRWKMRHRQDTRLVELWSRDGAAKAVADEAAALHNGSKSDPRLPFGGIKASGSAASCPTTASANSCTSRQCG